MGREHRDFVLPAVERPVLTIPQIVYRRQSVSGERLHKRLSVWAFPEIPRGFKSVSETKYGRNVNHPACPI